MRVFIVQLFVLYFLEPRLPIGAFIFVNIPHEAYLCYLVIVLKVISIHSKCLALTKCSIFGCGTSRKHKGYRINIFIKSNSFFQLSNKICNKSNKYFLHQQELRNRNLLPSACHSIYYINQSKTYVRNFKATRF